MHLSKMAKNPFQTQGRNNDCIFSFLSNGECKVKVEFSKRKFLEFRSYKKQGSTSKISRVGWTNGVWSLLDEVSHIHGHLLNGGVVERLNVPQGSPVIISHHVDGYSLSAKTTTPTNPDKTKKKCKVNKVHL